MPDTRRTFLRSATLAAGVTGAGAGLEASAGGARGAKSLPDPVRKGKIDIPRVDFGGVPVSRLILGVNPFYGYAHYNRNYGAIMRQWYTQARVVEVMKRCEAYGINAYNYVQLSRGLPDWKAYRAQGGRMNLVAQATPDDPAELVNAVHPMAAWVQGERTDDAYRAGKLETIRDYCKKLRDLGVKMVGVGSHIPEVLITVEEQGWDVDFYAGCVYNRRRTPRELRALLGGELPEMPREVYLQEDPPRMYSVFRQAKKPCVAFKILAAGRVSNPEAAFRRAFDSIKPTDMVCVGMFPRVKDEVSENAEIVTRVLRAT